ncbi:LysR family transcriptional regulator [Vibrio sp. CDRSL-10 TSBA]
MKLHQIKAFLAVSNAGSLKTAAEQLHLTQPALSKAIKELEQQYGVALFERTSGGLTLTPYGERLLGYARMMNETARRAKQDIDTMRGVSKLQHYHRRDAGCLADQVADDQPEWVYAALSGSDAAHY